MDYASRNLTHQTTANDALAQMLNVLSWCVKAHDQQEGKTSGRQRLCYIYVGFSLQWDTQSLHLLYYHCCFYCTAHFHVCFILFFEFCISLFSQSSYESSHFQFPSIYNTWNEKLFFIFRLSWIFLFILPCNTFSYLQSIIR